MCVGNLANNLQLVLMASRVPCFGVEALKVPGLPIPQSLCCLKFQLRRAHYPVRTVRRTVRAQCRAHFRAPHWQCTVPTGGKGRPSGLPRLARSAQIHSKCLPHSPPTRRAPFSTILNHSQPFSQSHISTASVHRPIAILKSR